MQTFAPCREIDSIGLLCNVDLFPVPHDNEISPRLTRHGRNPTPSTQPSSHQPRTPPSQHSQHRSHSHSYMAPNASPYMYSVPVPASTAIPIIPPPIPQNAYNPTLTSSSYPPRHYTSCSQPPSPPDVVYQLGDLSVTESSKLTSNLVGNTFVQPCCIEYQGKKSLMFVFSVRHLLSRDSFTDYGHGGSHPCGAATLSFHTAFPDSCVNLYVHF